MILCRKPSLWSSIVVRLLFAFLWAGFFFVASGLAWHRRARMPFFAFVLLAVFDLISLWVLVEVMGRFRRTMRHHEPVVEIDRESFHYGDSANLRLMACDSDIAELGIKLIGECWSESMTDVSEYRRTVTCYSRIYEEELARFAPPLDREVSRLLKVHLPDSAPAEAVRWKIVVDARLKGGSVVEHPFPLRVFEPIP